MVFTGSSCIRCLIIDYLMLPTHQTDLMGIRVMLDASYPQRDELRTQAKLISCKNRPNEHVAPTVDTVRPFFGVESSVLLTSVSSIYVFH